MRCAYLTMDDMSDFVSDADLSLEPMTALGWSVDYVPWRCASVNWNEFDAVYLCTPWDYPDDHTAFLEVLETIDASTALLVNCLDLVRWNLDKTYLRDIESRGGAIVPSQWHQSPAPDTLRACMEDFETDAIVAKPVIGANAVDTFVLRTGDSDATVKAVAARFAARRCLVQPFIKSVESEGEFSLFFFSGEYSHAIRKVPKAGDFRVQEEHGAEILSVRAESGLVEIARNTVALVQPQPVYARADFVRGAGGFLLMELELIEPSLYLRTDDGAAGRFARALDRYCRSKRHG